MHTFSDSPAPNFGYNYGDYLVQFNVIIPLPELVPTESLYQNVWSSGNYIYHTTTTGIAVYNSNASSLVNFINFSEFEYI